MESAEATNTPEQDMLRQIFVRQNELLALYVSKNRSIDFKTTVLAAYVELGEMLQETNWKPWKSPRSVDHAKLRDEAADAFHFLLQAIIMIGMTADDLYGAYMEKARINEERQLRGY